ncbi:MAG: xanthine dehydrogenase family protein subunit M [Armatimonadetes bacterium]|nr:xanthine dehydrogenase family protein subunit M [Armatimonadota bacterium]
MNAFDYERVATLDELVAALAGDPDGTRLLAGGTDLLVFMADGKLAPRKLLDPKRVPELNGISHNGTLRIGALTRMRDVELHPLVRSRYTALAQGAFEVGSVQIRHRATLGGNLGTASPAADTPPALLVHDAVVKLRGPDGVRKLPLGELYRGPGQTVLAPGEVIVAVKLPEHPARTGSWYIKLATRKAMDIAFVGVAARVTLAEDGRVAEARVALGAVAPVPLLAAEAGAAVTGSRLEDAALAAAAEAAMAASSPISDKRCSAEYRRAMVGVLTKRALRQAAALAEKR